MKNPEKYKPYMEMDRNLLPSSYLPKNVVKATEGLENTRLRDKQTSMSNGIFLSAWVYLCLKEGMRCLNQGDLFGCKS